MRRGGSLPTTCAGPCGPTRVWSPWARPTARWGPCSRGGPSRPSPGEAGVPLHVDAVGALGRLPIAVETDGIDLLTVSANDLYGPPGVGALWVRPGLHLAPQLLGGGQEGGLRSGTENLAGAVGLGVAAEFAFREGPGEAARLEVLRDRLVDGLGARCPSSRLVGPRRDRLPQHAAFVVPGVKGESLLLALDLAGISAASGTARALTGEPSHVLRAMGLGEREAQGALAFTLGRWTTADEVDVVLSDLPPIVERLRAASPLRVIPETRSPVKLVLFDIDGTLADRERGGAASARPGPAGRVRHGGPDRRLRLPGRDRPADHPRPPGARGDGRAGHRRRRGGGLPSLRGAARERRSETGAG